MQDKQYPGEWHPVLSCRAAGEWEQRLLGNDAEAIWQAMQAAGCAVAAQLLADFSMLGGLPAAPKMIVLAGKGHNAGDALLAAAEICRQYPAAQVWLLRTCADDALRPLTLRALQQLKAVVQLEMRQVSEQGDESQWLDVLDQLRSVRQWDVLLDGLFGMQGRSPLREPEKSLISVINDCRNVRLKVAVDCPSGLFADGFAGALQADATYATGIVKSHLFSEVGRVLAGRLRYCDLGFFANGYFGEEAPLRRVVSAPYLQHLQQWRDPWGFKHRHGHLYVIGGSRTYPGAVLMNVRSALHSGVGLVTAFVPESLVASFAAVLPEAIWVGWPETDDGHLALEGRYLWREREGAQTAVLAGSGIGSSKETKVLLHELLAESSSPWVIDGDLLDKDLVAIAECRQSGSLVLTPHAGEYSRMAGVKGYVADEDLAWFAHKSNALVALKEGWTRITDGNSVVVSPFGNAVLARAGSGDVLAGLIGGLVAENPQHVFASVVAAVAWQGKAADCLARKHGQRAAVATRVIDFLDQALLVD